MVELKSKTLKKLCDSLKSKCISIASVLSSNTVATLLLKHSLNSVKYIAYCHQSTTMQLSIILSLQAILLSTLSVTVNGLPTSHLDHWCPSVQSFLASVWHMTPAQQSQISSSMASSSFEQEVLPVQTKTEQKLPPCTVTEYVVATQTVYLDDDEMEMEPAPIWELDPEVVQKPLVAAGW
jgi:hypothetical protein